MDTTSGVGFVGRGNDGNRGRRLSPSRLSGGSFDVAVNFGNQLSVVRSSVNTANNAHGPSVSSPTNFSPSPLTEEAKSIVVQVHQFQ